MLSTGVVLLLLLALNYPPLDPLLLPLLLFLPVRYLNQPQNDGIYNYYSAGIIIYDDPMYTLQLIKKLYGRTKQMNVIVYFLCFFNFSGIANEICTVIIIIC